MESRDELVKARVRLQQENPFFSYLVMGLNLIEDTDGKYMSKDNLTCAVDLRGNLYYHPSFIEKLDQNEVKTLLSHEVLHIALLHLIRVKGIIPELQRDEKELAKLNGSEVEKIKAKMKLWNLATDLVINNTLIQNNFHFGDGLDKGLIPENNKFFFKKDNFWIKDIDKKTAEEIYNELYNKVKNEIENYKGFDNHIFVSEGDENDSDNKKKGGKGQGDGKNKNGLGGMSISKEELEKLQKEWKQRLAEASSYAKQQGREPRGMGRYIDELLNPKLNWRELLYKYITQEIPIDYNYNLPSKRSQVVGVYMPRIKKELVDITIAIDTSGSIGKEELTEFLSEVMGISRAFESIRMNIIFWDTEANNHYVVTNGNQEDILNFEIKGGGGTSFEEVYDYLDREVPNTRLLVFFTDGFANFPDAEQRKTLWVLTKNSVDEKQIPFGEIVRLDM